MKFVTANCSIGYPVYGAKFLNNRMLLVAGGGGEGNNGIPNKLTALRIDFAKKKIIKRFREITLDPNDDSPTTLDVANDTILMGCNENSQKIKKGEGNHHLRKFLFENEHLRFVAGIDFDRSKQPEDYTRLIYLSRDGSVGAIASSAIPTVIRIIDPKELTEKYEIETGHEVKDMHFAPDGKVIGYITASTLEIISIVTGRFIIRKTDFDSNYSLSKIKFLTDDVVLIAAALKKGTGIVMIKISLRSGSATVLKANFLTNKFKGVTAMDIDQKNELAVLAGSDNSLAVVKLGDLSLGRIFKQVHSFAITRVSFSPDSSLIASVSAANTVHVIKVPENFALSTSIWSKLWKLLLNFTFVAFVAFLVQICLKYDLHNRLTKFVKEWYDERRDRAIVKREDSEQVTLVGDFSDVPSSAAPTHFISGGNTISKVEPTTSFSLDGLSVQETFRDTISNTIESTTDTSNQSFSTSGSELTSSGVSSTTSEPSDCTTDAFSASSVLPVTTIEEVISGGIETESTLPVTTASVSNEITDASAKSFQQSVVNSLSHHGPTPKPSDSVDISLESVNKGTTNEHIHSDISTILGESLKTMDINSTVLGDLDGRPTTSQLSKEPLKTEVTTTTASTTSIMPSSETLASDVEHLTLQTERTEKPSGSTKLAGSTPETHTTISSKDTTIPTSHVHDKYERSSSIAATKIDSTPKLDQEVKSDFKESLVQTPNSLPPEATSAGNISPDDMTIGIVSETPSTTISPEISLDSSTHASDESSSVYNETNVSAPKNEEFGSPKNPTFSSTLMDSIDTPVQSSTIPSFSPSPSILDEIDTSSILKTSKTTALSETPTNDSTTYVENISSPTLSTTTYEFSSGSDSRFLSNSETKIESPTAKLSQVSEYTPVTLGEVGSTSAPVNLASDTGSSAQSFDAISLTSSPTTVQTKTTPTSEQISDANHVEEVVPGYVESLQTGSESSHIYPISSTTMAETFSTPSNIPTTTQNSSQSENTVTSKVDVTTQETDLGEKEESLQKSNEKEDVEEKYLEDLNERIDLGN